MAYSDDAVKAKLSSLNETQDSIVAVAQWIMFHRRHANRTAQLWLGRLQEAPTAKRLNLVYLANEVVQQSRARSKTDFLHAFEPLIADATAVAYKGASIEVQNKLKRVVEVWRQRSIFDTSIQSTVEKRIEELDRLRGGANGIGKAKLGGSLFGNSGSGVPAELDAVSKASAAISRAEITSKSAVPIADTEYAKMTDPETAIPTPPVHAARLNSLLKALASAHSAVDGCIKARKDIVAGLEKLLESHKSKLNIDEEQASSLKDRIDQIEIKKKEVEDHIMQGLATPEVATPQSAVGQSPSGNPDGKPDPTRPEPEAFTPPPPEIEAFTPPPPQADGPDQETFAIREAKLAETLLTSTTGADHIQERPVNFNEPPPAFQPPLALQQSLLRPAADESTTDDPRLKRRKVTHSAVAGDVDDEIFGQESIGVDEDGVAALLGN